MFWACTYHWFDVGMRHSVEFVKVELVFWTDIYICTFVLGTITVLGCREDYGRVSTGKPYAMGEADQ